MGRLASNAAANASVEESLRKGLRDLKYVEGRDFIIEHRTARGQVDRLPSLAEELVHARALYLVDDGFFFTHRATLLRLASKGKLPLVYGAREFADEGALIFYGADIVDSVRQSVVYIERSSRAPSRGTYQLNNRPGSS
jgi:hypothetical protein